MNLWNKLRSGQKHLDRSLGKTRNLRPLGGRAASHGDETNQ